MKLRVKNWHNFQHYKDRAPPWIKLHKTLLDDSKFQRLPDASRALAPCLWLLASEEKSGIFDGSVPEVAFRVHQSEKWVEAAIKPLISGGFFIVVQDASNALADCQQVATNSYTETEAETEAEAEAYKQDKTLNPLSGKPDDVLKYLNEKCGKKFQPVPANIKFITARLAEYGIDTLLRVIDYKAAEWSGTGMDQYLRPSTLFSAEKCAQYVGQLDTPVRKGNDNGKFNDSAATRRLMEQAVAQEKLDAGITAEADGDLRESLPKSKR